MRWQRIFSSLGSVTDFCQNRPSTAMKNQNILIPPYGDPLIHKLKKTPVLPSQVNFCFFLKKVVLPEGALKKKQKPNCFIC